MNVEALAIYTRGEIARILAELRGDRPDGGAASLRMVDGLDLAQERHKLFATHHPADGPLA
jgi:hypothetical protein